MWPMAHLASGGKDVGKVTELHISENHYETLLIRLMNVTEEILAEDPCKMVVKANEIHHRLDPTLDEFLFEKMLRDLCTKLKFAERFRWSAMILGG
jgi:hypothetical protein